MIDRGHDGMLKATSVKDALARVPVRAAEPPSHAMAREQLKDLGLAFLRVIVACPEAIIYQDADGEILTAWTEAKQDGKVTLLFCERGMPALSLAERAGFFYEKGYWNV